MPQGRKGACVGAEASQHFSLCSFCHVSQQFIAVSCVASTFSARHHSCACCPLFLAHWLPSSCLTWAALSQPQSCFGCSTRDDVSSLWLRGATAPCFSFLDCSVMSWRPIYPGQLKPTTLPLRRLAPVSCSVGLSPTLSLPISLALSCSISPVAPLCSFPTVLYPLSLKEGRGGGGGWLVPWIPLPF